ncbi:hypothetical protein BH20ACT3_BH20ACT3_16520 [soil metagenome]
MSLAELLPPVGWADIATRRDLDALEERVGSRFELLESRVNHRFAVVDARFEAVDARFDLVVEQLTVVEHRVLAELHRTTARLTRSLFLALVMTQVAFAGIVIAALQLGG